ncbi:MAG: DNA recombination protein RmuC [Ilumatobacteraceae bacterium]
MDPLVILVSIAAVLAVAATYALATRHAERSAAARMAEHDATAANLQAAVDEAVQHAVREVREQAVAERDQAVEHNAVLQREQLGEATAQAHQRVNADLSSKKDLIDSRLDQVHGEMRNELARLSEMVSALGRSSAEKFGQVESSLEAHVEVTSTLADSTRSLREALASPQARGQWGERMAEDVLRLAGLQENVNYQKQTQVEGGSGRPDYTFSMPRGHALYMDVKFPMSSYLRYLEAGSDAERQAHLKRFLSDVRLRVKELARRDYGGEGTRSSVDYVLLFIPNEQLTGFIHEHDPELIDHAMGQQVVLCSPLTLFAFLGVIRQAYDNYVLEQTSDEMLRLLGSFNTQWRKYVDQVDKVRKRFDAVDRGFEELTGPRRRGLEKPLLQLEALRLQKGLPVDGELFAVDDAPDDTETPPGGTVRRLGA